MNYESELVECLVEDVADYMKRNINKHYPELDMDTVDTDIYYMNGNDGTDFDWECNGRTCEFFLWYKTTELGLIKVYLTNSGYLEGYLWKDEGRARGIELESEFYTDAPEDYEAVLEYDYDACSKYDEVIGSIN